MELARYDAMVLAIAEAHDIDEVRDIRSHAMALEIYAQQAKNFEAERQVREIRLRAERRCGELLKQRLMATGTRGRGRPPIGAPSRVAPKSERTLAAEGISHNQSALWQKMADIPVDTFEEAIKQPKPTSTNVIDFANKKAQQREAYKQKQAKAFEEREEDFEQLRKKLIAIGLALDRIAANQYSIKRLVDKIGLEPEKYPIGVQQELNSIAAKYRLVVKWFEK